MGVVICSVTCQNLDFQLEEKRRDLEKLFAFPIFFPRVPIAVNFRSADQINGAYILRHAPDNTG